jgi:1-phosphofructokinase family hexose kinase
MFGPLNQKLRYLKCVGTMNNIYTVTLNPAVDRELTVPSIEFDRVLRATYWQVDFGGKGFNVSRMLKSLGTASTALGFAGGKSGEILKNGLESLGINTDFVWVKGDTRTNVSIVTEKHDHHIKVNEPGPTISLSEQQALVTKIKSLSQPGDWWVLAGSLPPGIPASFYHDLIQIIQKAQAQVILDTSGEALTQGTKAGPFLIKPNEVELQKLTSLPIANNAQLLHAAHFVQSLGVTNLLISMGKKGAILVNDNNEYLISSPSIQERNPIGAGDSMVGGFVWGLSHNLDIVESARWGVACGSAAASLSGTAVGSVDLVQQLFGQTSVKSVKND